MLLVLLVNMIRHAHVQQYRVPESIRVCFCFCCVFWRVAEEGDTKDDLQLPTYPEGFGNEIKGKFDEGLTLVRLFDRRNELVLYGYVLLNSAVKLFVNYGRTSSCRRSSVWCDLSRVVSGVGARALVSSFSRLVSDAVCRYVIAFEANPPDTLYLLWNKVPMVCTSHYTHSYAFSLQVA